VTGPTGLHVATIGATLSDEQAAGPLPDGATDEELAALLLREHVTDATAALTGELYG
jgi:hypothetical protein